MLNYTVITRRKENGYFVAYNTPGCCSMTISCECSTEQQAQFEADRLNAEQARREEAIKRERELRGMRRIGSNLEVFSG